MAARHLACGFGFWCFFALLMFSTVIFSPSRIEDGALAALVLARQHDHRVAFANLVHLTEPREPARRSS